MRYIIPLLFLFILTSCEKAEVETCIDESAQDQLIELKEVFSDQCVSNFQVYRYKNVDYLVYGNPCANTIISPINCLGEILCNGIQECKDFIENAELIRNIN